MTQAIVLASSLHVYRNFLQQFELNKGDYRYPYEWSDVCGFKWDMPVIILEGYEYNKNYTLQFMNALGHRFNNIGFLSEGERWNDTMVETKET